MSSFISRSLLWFLSLRRFWILSILLCVYMLYSHTQIYIYNRHMVRAHAHGIFIYASAWLLVIYWFPWCALIWLCGSLTFWMTHWLMLNFIYHLFLCLSITAMLLILLLAFLPSFIYHILYSTFSPILMRFIRTFTNVIYWIQFHWFVKKLCILAAGSWAFLSITTKKTWYIYNYAYHRFICCDVVHIYAYMIGTRI